MKRANWLGAPAAFNLNQACRVITEAFGYSTYLVGSALARRDYRDVDVRCILDDAEFARLFPVAAKLSAPQCVLVASVYGHLGVAVEPHGPARGFSVSIADGGE